MIIVHSQAGVRQEFEAVARRSLMLQLRPLKVGVIGLCGGNAMCGTCHVVVSDDDRFGGLEPPDEYEEELLAGLPQRQPRSRLACQLVYEPSMDGLEITVDVRR